MTRTTIIKCDICHGDSLRSPKDFQTERRLFFSVTEPSETEPGLKCEKWENFDLCCRCYEIVQFEIQEAKKRFSN